MGFQQHVTFLFVSDLARSRAFYEEMLGLDLVLEQPGCSILRLTQTSFLGLCERSPVQTQSLILTFVPDDLEAEHRRLRAAGVQCDGDPRYNERYDIDQFFATDPDGYVLEFQRFRSAQWPQS